MCVLFQHSAKQSNNFPNHLTIFSLAQTIFKSVTEPCYSGGANKTNNIGEMLVYSYLVLFSKIQYIRQSQYLYFHGYSYMCACFSSTDKQQETGKTPFAAGKKSQ